MKKIVGLTLDLSTKAVLSLDKYQLKNMSWKLSFCYCSFTFHTSYKNGMIGHGGWEGGRCQNAQKHIKTY